MKGHQHETADCKLTLLEKLNIDCDAQAVALIPLPTQSPSCSNLLTHAGYPHLIIKDQWIIQRLQHMLCDAATQQPYFDYLTSKFQWTQSTEHMVYWPIIWPALQRFKVTEWQMVQKFFHEWLPLQDCYHVQSNSTDHICPSCQQAAGTVNHFLACWHHDQQQIWKELLHKSLFHHQIKHSVSNVFHDILAFGLYQGQQEPTTIQHHDLPDDLNELYLTQEWMGWKQLYYGWITPLWHDLLQKYHLQVNGNHYYVKILQLV